MAPSDVVFEFVESPTEGLAEEAVTVFAKLMVDDPAAIALTAGDLSLIPDLSRTMIRALLLTPGISHTFTARDENGALVGYTIFTLPGHLLLSTEGQRQNGRLYDFMGKLAPEGQMYYAETMGKDVPAANDAMFGVTEAERNTYWCNFAMVRAEDQGKGVAKALFQLAFRECARYGATIALTTTNIRNVPIYEKIGLKCYGEKVIPSPWGDWNMWFFAKEGSTPEALEDDVEIGTAV